MSEQKTVIEAGKKYRLRGVPVVILCTDVPGRYPIRGYKLDSEYGSFKATHFGRTPAGAQLVEVSPYEDFKDGEPVMVKRESSFWARGNFSGVNSHGRPTTYVKGTAWASRGLREWWDECRRPTEEELPS
jgi:hypothetical protein